MFEQVKRAKGMTLWGTGIGIGAGWLLLDRFLHILPDGLSIAVFLIAWMFIIAGLWKQGVKK